MGGRVISAASWRKVRGGEGLKIKVRVADPAGNITVFVMTPVAREKYPAISRQILARKELKGEQVGFVERTDQGRFRMEMMGGEFCGNATRSFAYLLSMLSGQEQQELDVEVSGSEKPLKAVVDRTEGTSQVEMPLPKKIMVLETETGETYPVVVFDGICHVIVEGEPRKGEFVEDILKRAKEMCPCGAWGIMFLKGDQMTPAVYVESTDSLVWESSCGSGSMAAAVYLSQREGDGEYFYTLYQPGGEIRAAVSKKTGEIVRCTMGGPVRISQEMELEIEDNEVDII